MSILGQLLQNFDSFTYVLHDNTLMVSEHIMLHCVKLQVTSFMDLFAKMHVPKRTVSKCSCQSAQCQNAQCQNTCVKTHSVKSTVSKRTQYIPIVLFYTYGVGTNSCCSKCMYKITIYCTILYVHRQRMWLWFYTQKKSNFCNLKKNNKRT